MLKNYLKIALRNVTRSKVYSAINLFGLALGMACAILVLRFVQYERSYDTFPADANRIVRVEQEYIDRHGDVQRSALTPGPLAAILKDEVPAVERAVRLFTYSWKETPVVAHGEVRNYEPGFFLADPGFFDVFTRQFLYGDAATALQAPDALVLTASAAQRYFGHKDPLGQTLEVTLYDTYTFRITGVVEDFPPNAHFQADFIASTAAGAQLLWKDFGTAWRSADFYTYLILAEGSATRATTPAIRRVARTHQQTETTLHLQPLRRIHLHSHLRDEIAPNGDARMLYFFGLLALGVLGIACINYMNLAMAKSLGRVREIGIRKVVGAHRGQLIWQFLGESVVLALLALPLALLLVEAALPAFQVLTGSLLPLNLYRDLPTLLPLTLLVIVITGGLAGLYPAFFLSAFRPTAILKGTMRLGTGCSWVRSALLVFQFAVATLFIAGTLGVSQQLHFIQQKDLGFDDEAVVVLPLKDEAVRQRFDVMKRALLDQSAVIQVTATTFLPGDNSRSYSDIREEGTQSDGPLLMRWNSVSPDFPATFGLDLAIGRSFSDTDVSETTHALMLNASAVQQLGWADPLGKTLTLDPSAAVPIQGTVVGVLEDFHFASLYQRIEPLVLYMAPERYEYMAAKLQPDRLREGLAALRSTWQRINPEQPFEYAFLDARLEAVYQQATRMSSVFRYASFLAIVIACLGLFGLAAFTSERRTKEIGIRKVLGASVPVLVLLLSKDLLRLITLAFIIGTPLAYVGIHRWLANFAYQAEIGVGIFALAGALTVAIAWLTVSYHAIRAALADPVKSLRYE